jgi:hypothetical protein
MAKRYLESINDETILSPSGSLSDSIPEKAV